MADTSFILLPGEPHGGLIFDANSGLCPTGQMALELGNWDVIAFEKDRATWEKASQIIQAHVEAVNRKDDVMLQQIANSFEFQTVWAKIQESGITSLTDAEVR